MRRNRLYLSVLFITSLSLSCFAQVKQVYQVFDFDTKQPLAGATTTLYVHSPSAKGNVVTLTTNAQGVAVANLPADMKGEYLCVEAWKKDGYVNIGPFLSSYFQACQTKDTIKLYMAETSKYRDEQSQMFEALFRFLYKDEILATTQQFEKEVEENPDRATSLASSLIEAAYTPNTNVRKCSEDACEINRYDFYRFDKTQFQEVLAVLRTGDVNKAVAMAKSHIDMKDNSRENLDWIDFYIKLRFLEASVEDEDPVCDYSEILYRNHYHPFVNSHYILDLQRNNQFDKADSIAKIEKANNKIPRYKAYYEPSYFKYIYVENEPAKLKTTAENALSFVQNLYRDYPDENTLGDLSWMYKNLYLVYTILGDSASAVRSVDSAMTYYQKLLDRYPTDAYNRNQTRIHLYQNLADVVSYNPSYLSGSTLCKIYDEVYEASKANYDNDTANLFLKLQLAENALNWLQNVLGVEESEAKRMEVLQQLVDMDFALSKDFPEYYSVQNVQAASQLLAQYLMNPSDNDQIQKAFRQYERSFDVVNAQYPKMFVDQYVRFNSLVEGYLTANQQFVLTSELSEFTDRLLNIKAENDPQKLLVKKAENANEMAENLYSQELYEESIAYYLQSNEYYEKAIPQDESLWIPFLTNYLQMGDAHLYQNQYDKALLTYQQILDFEPQIPASVLPKYTQLKGSVYYYKGDIYRAMEDLKQADKEYKTAEKFYKKSISMGNDEAYLQLGEMYWGKAVVASQKGDMKKCRQYVEQCVAYYESVPMDRPLRTYARAKSVMADFYKEEKDAENYYRTIADLTDFYEKFAGYDRDYAVGLVQNAEKMLNSGAISNEDALRYSHDLLDGIMFLNDAGEDVRLAVLRGTFNLAKAYNANDSVQVAIGLLRDCLKISEVMYADTAMDTHKGNMVEIYGQLVKCYERMAERVDTAHSELWYYQAIDTRDTLIDLMKDLASDGDVNRTYRMAVQYKNNAMIYYRLEMIPSAQDYLNKSIELLKMLYNSEYKTEVEEDLIFHYYLKGYIYAENNNDEKAVENLRIAVDYGEKADTSEGVSRYYFMAVNELIEVLSKDIAANAAEIAKLTKTQKALKKFF